MSCISVTATNFKHKEFLRDCFAQKFAKKLANMLNVRKFFKVIYHESTEKHTALSFRIRFGVLILQCGHYYRDMLVALRNWINKL